MKKSFLLIYAALLLVSSTSYGVESHDPLIEQLKCAAVTGDKTLVKEAIQAVLEQENSTEILSSLFAKYNRKGKLDSILSKASKDKNLLATLIIAYYGNEEGSED